MRYILKTIVVLAFLATIVVGPVNYFFPLRGYVDHGVGSITTLGELR